jgi:S-(hydroxymethyl)glutathione dehydrogenase / alcohol dehydrogenase
MKAAVFQATHQPMTIEDVTVDEPLDRELIVRTVATGVCHSDVHYTEGISNPGFLPAVLGHEAAGIVESVGPGVTEVRPGDHVIVCLSAFCGQCEYCLTGRTHLCDAKPNRTPDQRPRLTWNGQALWQHQGMGAYGEQMLVHENGVVKIPDEMPLDAAALLSCGVLTGVGAALFTAKVAPGSRVAVFGVGGIGMSAIQGARIAGARQIIAIDLLDSKLERARDFGATHTVNASTDDPVETIRAMTNGGVDYAFEAIGLPVTVEQAFEAIRNGGVATVIGVTNPATRVSLPVFPLISEKTLTGSRMGSNRFKVDLPKLIDLYFQGRLQVDELISHRVGLNEVNEAFAALVERKPDVMRSVVMFE